MKKTILLLAATTMLAGCGTFERMGRIGKAPPMSPSDDYAMPAIEPSLGAPRQAAAGTPPPQRPAPAPAPATSASLFRPGAGSFLGDQRASRVGDILTIRINIADKAELGNNSSRTRTGSENASVASLLGLDKLLPDSIDPTNLASTKSSSQSNGGGSISRSETINMAMSGIVTGVFPNGNLAIRGRQEVRVNYELRELLLTGIVRPQDIARDNSIRHIQIAEARISYGGRGQLSDAQQARWGQQIYDALFPF